METHPHFINIKLYINMGPRGIIVRLIFYREHEVTEKFMICQRLERFSPHQLLAGVSEPCFPVNVVILDCWLCVLL